MDDLRILRELGQDLEHEPPATLARQRNRLYGRPRRRLSWLTLGLAAAATALAIAVPAAVVNLRPDTVAGLTEKPRPAAVVPGATTILVVGSDSETGTPRFRNGARSDLLLVVQITADRKRAQVVSVPREVMTKLPSCGGGKLDMINAAYRAGGLRCTWETIEQAVDVRVDHAIELDFSGFAAIVDELGGIEMTIPEAVDDKRAKLKLKAGTQVLTGAQAVGYVRLRSGTGHDTGRVRRQQEFMRALAAKARTSLSDPGELSAFLVAARGHVTTDESFDLETMQALALGLANTRIDYTEVPVEAHPEDPNRVVLVTKEAKALFRRLK